MGRDQWTAMVKADRKENDLIVSLYLLRASCVVLRLNAAWNENHADGQDTELKIVLHGGAFGRTDDARVIPLQDVDMHRVRGGCFFLQQKTVPFDQDDIYDRSSCFCVCTLGPNAVILQRYVEGDSSHGDTDTRITWAFTKLPPAHIAAETVRRCYIRSWDSDIAVILLLHTSDSDRGQKIWVKIKRHCVCLIATSGLVNTP